MQITINGVRVQFHLGDDDQVFAHVGDRELGPFPSSEAAMRGVAAAIKQRDARSIARTTA